MLPGKNAILSALADQLAGPLHPLLGRRPGRRVLPDNVICSQRRPTAGLWRPGRGRALHDLVVRVRAFPPGSESDQFSDRHLGLNARLWLAKPQK
jgi:hypothetical protein